MIHLVHTQEFANGGHGGTVTSTNHDVCLISGLRIFELLDVGLYLAGEAVGKVKDGTAPELALLECPHVKSSDDTEIVATTAEREEEVRVLVGVGINNFSRRQDNLEIGHIVRNEAFSRRKEGQAT